VDRVIQILPANITKDDLSLLVSRYDSDIVCTFEKRVILLVLGDVLTFLKLDAKERLYITILGCLYNYVLSCTDLIKSSLGMMSMWVV